MLNRAPSSAGHSHVKWYRRLAKDVRTNGALYVYLLPAVLITLLFHYLPMYGVQIAFRDFRPAKGITGSAWVGFKHFQRFFASYQFGALIRNTLGLSMLSLVLAFISAPLPVVCFTSVLVALSFYHLWLNLSIAF